ncbi:tetratricopeptide repeat protein [Massilia sp. B-10]|nr:tetratricopeptide repeat protein [Massilia sp. B-10]
MQQAHLLLKAAGADSYVLDATEGLSVVYEKSGRHREALAALREAVALREKATARTARKPSPRRRRNFQPSARTMRSSACRWRMLGARPKSTPAPGSSGCGRPPPWPWRWARYC